MDDADLGWLRRRSKRRHAGNLSAAVTEATRVLRKQEALRAFLERERVPRLEPTGLAQIQAEWRRPASRTRKHRAA